MMVIIRAEEPEELRKPQGKRKKVEGMPWWVGKVMSIHIEDQEEPMVKVQWFGKPKVVTGSYFPGWTDGSGHYMYGVSSSSTQTKYTDMVPMQSIITWDFQLTQAGRVPKTTIEEIESNPNMTWRRGKKQRREETPSDTE